MPIGRLQNTLKDSSNGPLASCITKAGPSFERIAKDPPLLLQSRYRNFTLTYRHYQLMDSFPLCSTVYLQFSSVVQPVVPTGVAVALLLLVVAVARQPAFTFPN